ncbi:MAG: hypothetical protein ABSF90_08500 [Syntrophobacteraceae bacterium]|jgi:hypothetical protein
MDDLLTAKVCSIRECGKNEFWLRDKIYDDPTILGLGNLQAVTKEKVQPQGGRLDLLLKNPEDDSMYEVEIQLGPTDESHIIRTIEYWESEKKRWPRRSHTAVLIAESITNRFFNVVNLLSQAVPIIGIQANIVQVADVQGLHFTKIIDSYEEPDEETQPAYDEKHWIKQYPSALDCARWYRETLEKLYGDIPIRYFETYISLTVAGKARVWIDGRKSKRAYIQIKPSEETFAEVVEDLNSKDFGFSTGQNEYINVNTDFSELQDKASIHEWLAARIAPGSLKSVQ